MAENEKEVAQRRVPKVLVNQLFRVMLRMLPFLPGPELFDLIVEIQRSSSALDEKVHRATESLRESAELVSELEQALQDRLEKVERLRSQYEHFSKLAEVEEEQARALVQQLEIAVGRGRGKERLIALALNLFAGIIIFVLGIALGPWLTSVLGLGAR